VSTPLVSVILPAYDYARFLPAAIDGALAQDWPAVEVIVVDDGSTDATPAVIAAYGDRVRSVRRPNGGLNAATTTGIGLARGDFLTFLDADDTWRPDRVRLLAEALLAAPAAGLAYGDMELVDEHGRVTAPSFRRATGLPALSGDIQGVLLARNIVSAGAMMVRASLKHLFEPIGPQAAWQDWWIAAHVARAAPVVAIDAPVNCYRDHHANMNLGADADRLVELLRAEVEFRRLLLSTVAPASVTADDLVRGLGAFDGSLRRIAGADGVAPGALVAPSTDERRTSARRLGQARAAITAGDGAEALRHAVAAVALTPADDAARLVAVDALRSVRDPDRAPLQARATVVAVSLGELLADPGLLGAWRRTVCADDDLTLAICGVTDAGTTAQLVQLVTAAGLAEDGPDLLAADVHDRASLAWRLGRPPAAVCSIAQWREQQLDEQLRVAPHALAGGA
jgi:hypothetical protein